MKVLVVTPYFYPHKGGTERYIEELYGAVIRLDPELQVSILTYNTEKVSKEDKYKGMEIYRVGTWEILRDQFALPNYLELWRVLRKLKGERFDVVNAHTRFFDTAWWGWLAAKYLGAKSILTDHCAYHPQHKSRLARLVARVVDALAIPFLGKVYDEITVVSQATADFLASQGLKRKPKVIYGGVNVQDYGDEKKHEGLRVTFLGRMIPTKGPQLLLESAVKLVKDYPQATFVFAGDGELLSELKKAESERIQFLGQIDRSNVVKLLNQTDILVAPSTHHEGLPSVILEAGAASCAVVATDRGGTKELIGDGETGLIIEPSVGDIEVAIRKLLDIPELRLSLGKTLRKMVEENFEWGRIAIEYMGLLANFKRKNL